MGRKEERIVKIVAIGVALLFIGTAIIVAVSALI